MPVDSFFGTEVGLKRTANQDAVLVDPALELFVVADGMGGHPNGDDASRLVVDSVRWFVLDSALDQEKTWPFEFDVGLSYTANRLKGALLFANRRLAQHVAAGGPKGMGATVAA